MTVDFGRPFGQVDVFEIISIRQVETFWVELDFSLLSASKLSDKNWKFFRKFPDKIFLLEFLKSKTSFTLEGDTKELMPWYEITDLYFDNNFLTI